MTSKPTVLITGVAGRVGSTLAHRLARSGYRVRGMLRPGGKPLSGALPQVETVVAALEDASALAKAVSGVDVIVHLAAQMPLGSTSVMDYFDVNVSGTVRLVEAAVNQKNPVNRFVYGSTDNTYGPAHRIETPISEEHPQVPGDYYGTSKVLSEILVKNYHKLHGLEYSILRFGSILAPNEATQLFRLDWTRAYLAAQEAAGNRGNLWQLFRQCEDAVSILDSAVRNRVDNPAVALVGDDGEPWATHLTDVRDVVNGIVLAIERDAAANEEFNIVGPHTTTFEEAANVIAKQFNLQKVTVKMPMKLSFELTTEKARRLLGYEPRWDFEGMVKSGVRSGQSSMEEYIPVG